MSESNVKKIIGIIFTLIGLGCLLIAFGILRAMLRDGNTIDAWITSTIILIIGSPFGIIGLVFLYRLRQEAMNEDLLEEIGIRKQAVVADHKASEYWVSGVRLYSLVVRTEDGEEYRSEAFEKIKLKVKYPIGSTVELLLHPTDSNIYRVEAWVDR
ncbi:MAG: DUF3592 domain-containing protein [Peptostreptococcaceae bacterium]|nr:DUF3592 domain-containing protein [Peptostreptococcaceae bacterium]